MGKLLRDLSKFQTRIKWLKPAEIMFYRRPSQAFLAHLSPFPELPIPSQDGDDLLRSFSSSALSSDRAQGKYRLRAALLTKNCVLEQPFQGIAHKDFENALLLMVVKCHYQVIRMAQKSNKYLNKYRNK